MATDTPSSESRTHSNQERTVKCPVEGCDAEKLARGVHLHVRQSDGNGHGPQGDVPENINFENLETVGEQTVKMDYPEKRDTERSARLCPYCERPFQGKHGVMIHLGQVAGRKNHPEDASERHDPDDFPIAHVDDNENVIEIVEEPTEMPSTRHRRDGESSTDNPEKIQMYIESLRAQGLDDEADRAEEMLLGDS